MVDDAFGAVVDFIAGLTRAKAEIDVLPAILIVGAQTTELLPDSAAKERAGGGHGLEATRDGSSGMVGGKPRVDVMRRDIETEDDPGMLNGVIGEEELRADDGRVRMIERVAQRDSPASLAWGWCRC